MTLESHPAAAQSPPAASRNKIPRPAGGLAWAGLLAALLFAAAPVEAAPGAAEPPAEATPEAVVELSEPMKIALLLAKAAGGGVGFVGAALALDESATPAEVAIIQAVPLERMKTGEILMLAKDDCRSPTGCLMARRITEKRGAEVATQHYGRRAPEAAKSVDASVVGRVAYVVDLDTGGIRDMRRDDAKQISLVEALRREARKWHYVGNTVRPRPLRI